MLWHLLGWLDLPITDGVTCGGKRPNILDCPDNWLETAGPGAFVDDVMMEKPPGPCPDALPIILREGDPGVWTSCPKDPTKTQINYSKQKSFLVLTLKFNEMQFEPGKLNVEPVWTEGFKPRLARLVASPASWSTNTCEDGPSNGRWCCEVRRIAGGGAAGFKRADATLDMYKLVQLVTICIIASESSCEIVLKQNKINLIIIITAYKN